jgi:ribosomal-protein-alanine N-acetyltransferase
MRVLPEPDEVKMKGIYSACLMIHRQAFSGIEQMTAATFFKEYNRSALFVHRNNIGQIVAFAMVTISRGQPWLMEIAVHADWRGQGIGSSLLREVDQWAKSMNYDYIELTVKVNNPAQKLYFDHGYRVEKVLERYYLQEGDGLLMHLNLRRTV